MTKSDKNINKESRVTRKARTTKINEYDIINEQYPNINFSIALSLKELDKILTPDKAIILKCEFSCYCYSIYPRETEYIYITTENINGITNRDIINKLEIINFNTGCNHAFLEGFIFDSYDENGNKIFCPMFGS